MKALVSVLLVLVLLVCTAVVVVNLRPEALMRYDAVAAFVYTVDELLGGGRGSLNAENEAVQSLRVIGEEQIAAELAAGIQNFETTITVQFNAPYDDVESDAMSRYMLSQVENAFAAIRKDYPEIFWMSLGTYDLQWESVSGESVVTLYLQMKYCYTRAEAEIRERRIGAVLEGILAEAPADPAEAVRHFHDWIINNTIYDTEVVENEAMEGHESAFNIDGVFLNGSAVCEGYTKAFKLLCDRAGIPCVIVFGSADGENHGWNYVQLDGGWYLVDCTWDDPVSTMDVLIWDYFLKGSDSMVGGERVGDLYRNDGGAYPVLARNAYGILAEEESVGAGHSDIYVDASIYQLYQDGPGTARDEAVGAVQAAGGRAPYRYSLTDSGADNPFFSIDADSGALFVAAERLPQGSYQVEIGVTDSRGYAAVAALRFAVDPPREEDGPARAA